MGHRSWLMWVFGLSFGAVGLLLGYALIRRALGHVAADATDSVEAGGGPEGPARTPTSRAGDELGATRPSKPRAPAATGDPRRTTADPGLPGWRRWSPLRPDAGPAQPYALIVSVVASLALGVMLSKNLERDAEQAQVASRLHATTGTWVSGEVRLRETLVGDERRTFAGGTSTRPVMALQSHVLVLDYRYTVDGTSYQGWRVDFTDRGHGRATDAQARLAALRAASPLTVYYDPQRPEYSVLDPRYTTNTQSPFFWAGCLFLLLFVALAVHQARQLAGPALERLRRVAPVGLMLVGVPLLADLSILAWYAPVAARAQPVEGYLVEMIGEGRFPVQVRVKALHRPPDARESIPGGEWRFGTRFVWTMAAFDDLRRQHEAAGSLRTFWMDPHRPSDVVMVREAGALFGPELRLVMASLLAALGMACLVRRRPRES